MKVCIIAIGQKMPSWAQQAFDDYAKRMPPEWKFACKALKAEPRSSGTSTAKIMQAEAERIAQAIASLGKNTCVVVLDEHGKGQTTQQLAQFITEVQEQGQGDNLAFIIGGADGLDPSVKAAAQRQIRVSDMTLPHAMVRVLLTEQIYRAWSLAAGHPYHRE
jgi:23S rRNA (pseudouridine1915-N3)-methyltransferase